MKHLVALFIAFVCVAGAARPGTAEVRWYTSIDEAERLAREFNRPLMLDFWADWCAACRVMEKDVYPTPEFERAAASFVLVRVDADRRTDLMRKYGVAGLPALVFTDSYGTELFRYLGFMDLKPITELLESLPQDVSEFNRLSRALAADRNNFEALDGMGARLRAVGLYRTSNDYYARALQRNEAKRDPAAREAILPAMAANYLEIEDGKKAADMFQRCLKEFPNSPRRAEWTAGLQRARRIVPTTR